MVGGQPLLAQEEAQKPRFYLGASYGTSYSIGDFRDTDINNPDAGFAKNGYKIDIFGGAPLSERVILTAGFRYQNFETEINDPIDTYNAENPGANFTGSTEDWQTYYLLVGLAHRVNLGKKFAFFPRFGLGPLFVSNPGINISSPNGAITQNFIRSSETGIGLGGEIGVGLQTNLGKRFTLLPTFTFSGGIVTIPDVATTTDNVIIISDYRPRIRSFNLGLSLGYQFY